MPDAIPRHVGQTPSRQAAGNLSDRAHAVRFQIERPDQQDGCCDNRQGDREAPAFEASQKLNRDSAQTNRKCRQMRVREVAHHIQSQRQHGVSARQLDPQQVPKLAEADHNGACGGKAADHGMRDEVEQKTRTAQPECDLYRPDQQRQRGRPTGYRRHIGNGTRRSDAGIGHQQRHNSDRPDRKLPRRTQARISEQGHSRGIQPNHRRQPGQHRIGHRLRH